MKKYINVLLVLTFFTFTAECFAQQWVRTYNNINGGLKDGEDKAYAIAIDSDGFIIVTGYGYGWLTGADIVTIKYKPNGDTLWVKPFKGPGSSEDKAYAITVDDLDNIYVGGYTQGSNGSSDLIVIKYSPAGDTLWTRRYDGETHGIDRASVICIDEANNIYVGGYTTGSSSAQDYITIKYNSAGARQWVKTYNGTGNNTDVITGIAVNNGITDCEDFVVVTGYSRSGQTEQTEDIFTISYNQQNGNVIFSNRFNGSETPVQDKAYAITVDKDNIIYITGYSLRSTSAKDIVILSYEYSGSTRWTKYYNGNGNNDDVAYSIIATDDNNVIVCGYTKTGSLPGTEDYITLDYHSNNGNFKWGKSLNGPGNNTDIANSMAISGNSQSVYVTGYSKSGLQRYDILTVKYKISNGDMQDSAKFNTTGFDENNASAIALNSSGDIYISGYSAPVDVTRSSSSPLKNTCILTLKYSGGLTLNPGGNPAPEMKLNSSKELKLNQNFPNPFNPSTVISFSLPSDAYVKITIYDMLGREIKTLVSEYLSSGEHTVQFDGGNLSSGIYLYDLNVNGTKEDIKKMMLIK